MGLDRNCLSWEQMFVSKGVNGMYKKAVKVIQQYLEENGFKPESYSLRVIMEDHVLQNYHLMLVMNPNVIFDLYYGGDSMSWELHMYTEIKRELIADY